MSLMKEIVYMDDIIDDNVDTIKELKKTAKLCDKLWEDKKQAGKER